MCGVLLFVSKCVDIAYTYCLCVKRHKAASQLAVVIWNGRASLHLLFLSVRVAHFWV